MTLLDIQDIKISAGEENIVKGLSLHVNEGEIVAIMGPNGSGKSTLANALMGHPSYEVTGGKIQFLDEDITEEKVENRAKKGLFLSFQHPTEIPGLVVKDYLRKMLEEQRGEKIKIVAFNKELKKEMEQLGIDWCFASRYLNDGFSGGEKKRMEMLQLALLKPKLAILDETDSGLDIDALKEVASTVRRLKSETGMSILIISHYKRMLDEIKPDRVIIMQQGKITYEGGAETVGELEAKGYSFLSEKEISCSECDLRNGKCPKHS